MSSVYHDIVYIVLSLGWAWCNWYLLKLRRTLGETRSILAKYTIVFHVGAIIVGAIIALIQLAHMLGLQNT